LVLPPSLLETVVANPAEVGRTERARVVEKGAVQDRLRRSSRWAVGARFRISPRWWRSWASGQGGYIVGSTVFLDGGMTLINAAADIDRRGRLRDTTAEEAGPGGVGE
jgi:hypothetical protein